MTRKEMLQLAKRELQEGADDIDVIELLEHRGCSSLEAEELVELANEELEQL